MDPLGAWGHPPTAGNAYACFRHRPPAAVDPLGLHDPFTGYFAQSWMELHKAQEKRRAEGLDYVTDAVCCCAIQNYIKEWESVLNKLVEMQEKWQLGQTYKDYGLTTFANAAGMRSAEYEESPTCLQDAVDRIESDLFATVTSAARLLYAGLFGEPSAWLASIAIEKERTERVLKEFHVIEKACIKKHGGTEKAFEIWIKTCCKEKEESK